MSSDLDFVLLAEGKLLDPAVRGDAAQLDQLLDSEFTEIGASGRIWNRTDLIVDLVASPRVDETLVAEMSARHVTRGGCRRVHDLDACAHSSSIVMVAMAWRRLALLLPPGDRAGSSLSSTV